jgi:hypothetical protein
MGMNLIRENKTSSFIVIGDSELIIKGLCKINTISHSNLHRIYQRIEIDEKNFHLVDYYNVFHWKNGEVDSLAKDTRQMDQGYIRVNEVLSTHFPP